MVASFFSSSFRLPMLPNAYSQKKRSYYLQIKTLIQNNALELHQSIMEFSAIKLNRPH
jgi:hypothetical protein